MPNIKSVNYVNYINYSINNITYLMRKIEPCQKKYYDYQKTIRKINY